MSKPSPLETEVYFIDYGNTEVVQPADLKPFRAAAAGDGAGPADLSASNEDGDGDNGVYSFVGGEEDDNVYGNVEATPETDLTPELRAQIRNGASDEEHDHHHHVIKPFPYVFFSLPPSTPSPPSPFNQ